MIIATRVRNVPWWFSFFGFFLIFGFGTCVFFEEWRIGLRKVVYTFKNPGFLVVIFTKSLCGD